jgi:START domain
MCGASSGASVSVHDRWVALSAPASNTPCASSGLKTPPRVRLQVMDFYLSDPDRQRWDNMLTVAETIESGRFSEREQVVHWVRTFPFAFLSDRSYVIARRMFEVDGVLYGISKVVKHPQDDAGRTVRMDNYWSMWCCRPAPCPFGTGEGDNDAVLPQVGTC